MKFSIAYYLLLLYVTVMLKPLIPMLSDAWSHCFAEAEHIATVHAKFGANHVEKQLADSEKDANGKSQDTTKTAEPVPVHFSYNTYLCITSVEPIINAYNLPRLYKPRSVFLSKQIRPPQFSC